MSEALDSKRYLYTARDGQDGGTHRPFEEDRAACSSVSQLHLMGGYVEGLASEGSDSSSQGPPTSPRGSRKMVRSLHQEDVEMKSSGSSGSGTESHGNESHGNESHGNESHGNESHGNESLGSSNGNSKDSALLQSSASNKSSNSHSPSPRSSSNAYSLLSASSELDNPSTSGCSSEESAKAKIQKELLKTLKELKRHLPSEKRNKRSTSNTLNTLKYALRCVKQVKANEEYYQLLMINDSQPSGFDVSSYTIEEIDSITSEYTLKNTDIFAVAVSLITGKIVYISDQASSILNCKQDAFKNGKFVEFLSPQDVSVFYSFTTPYRLPSWSMCTGAESSPSDCMQEKSFFCRISGGRERGGDLQYYPFRMTPYLMKVQDTTHSEDQFCCLLLAERVHSGYEAPRIPTDKRIFTTTHTPNCMFQDVDERAVPLLGYLPQDLIGTPVLLHLHPNDRPIMLAVHRKILQFAGQPFDHSSIRFCTNNGEYITIDTSWSSFVNPWSHKVSFIIGRHKVRMGPVNEDVFAAPPCAEGRPADSDIQEITESIHRLLLQPVHSNGSSGYGSNEHMLNAASSSDSNGNGSRAGPEEEREEEGSKAKPRTFHEICKGVHMQKNQEQQVSLSFSAKTETKRSSGKFQQKISVVRPRYSGWKENMVSPEDRSLVQEDLTYKDQTVNSYQQISCLDSVIRYLESCSVPITVKRKCQSSSNTTSSNSDEDSRKTPDDAMQGSRETRLLEAEPGLPSTKQTAVGSSLVPLARPSKAESVVSLPSQCSYSSTIVHVGDKKPQPESEIIEDMAGIGETVDVPVPVPPPSALSPPSQERGSYKKLGLTKQVLAAHTQKEEQTFLYRFRELRGVRAFQADCSLYLDRQRGHPGTDAVPSGQQCNRESGGAEPVTKCGGGAGASFWKGGRHRKTKCKRAKQQESSDSTASQSKQHRRAPPQGLNQASRSPSDNSQSTFPVAFPTVMPGYPMQMYPGTRPEPSLSGFGSSQCNPMQPTPFSTPMVTPVVALVLPNYVFPQMGGASQQTFYPQQTSILAQPEFPVQAQPAFPVQAQPAFPVQAQPAFPVQAQPAFPVQTQPAFPVQTQFTNHSSFLAQMPFTNQPFPYSLSAESPKTPVPEVRESLSRSSTPQTAGARDRGSPPLFQSRCSSPLQLNLLQLEETPRSVERQECMAPSAGVPGSSSSTVKPEKELPPRLFPLPGPVHSFGTSAPFPPSPGPLCAKDTRNLDVGLPCLRSEESLQWSKGNSKLRCCFEEVGSLGDGQQSDGNSSSSDLLDILLQEDSRSGTGSATSGSLGSGSNGMSVSGRGSSSNNSSQYFGSVDSSQDSRQARTCAMEVSESGHPVQYVLQDPPWLLMANVDQAVMMTYQLPSRDAEKVLKEDREKLRRMQKSQPRFTENQRKELVAVQPWMRKGGLPKAIDVKACSCCEEVNSTLNDDETPDLDMGETCEDYASRKGSEDPGLPGPVSSLVP